MNIRPIEFVGWIVVHCSGDAPDKDVGVNEIRRRHMQHGYADIGYHYVVRRDGTVEKGRNAAKAGHHALGYNRHSLAICMVGGRKARTTKAEDNFTPEQYDALWNLLTELMTWHPDAEVLGHRDLPGQATLAGMCPSFDVRVWLQERVDAEDKQVHSQDGDAARVRDGRLPDQG